MTTNTYFYITCNGNVYRKEVPVTEKYPLLASGLLPSGERAAAYADQVILLTKYGRGKTIKNRYSDRPQYFTRQEMVMLSLQAESI